MIEKLGSIRRIDVCIAPARQIMLDLVEQLPVSAELGLTDENAEEKCLQRLAACPGVCATMQR